MTKRICIIVLGMHRSGTSAATRTIGLLGAQLPRDPLRPTGDNPRGYWESRQLTILHQNFLQELDSSWNDWRKLNLEELSPERARYWQNEIQETLAQQFGAADLFIVKEPRICRFVPFFVQALNRFGAEPRIYIPFRHPLDVANSLRKRDDFPLEKGVLLWLRHILDAEANSRAFPRAFCSYDTLLSDWRAAMSHAADHLDIRWPRDFADAAEEIDSFLSPTLRHHATKNDEVSDNLFPWAREVLRALYQLEKHPAAPDAVATLARIRHEFEASEALFGVETREFSNQLAELREEKTLAEQRAQSLMEVNTQLEQQLALEHQNSQSINWLFKRIRKVISVRLGLSQLKEAPLSR